MDAGVAAEVVGATREAVEVGDGGVAQGQAVGPPGLAVGPPAPVPKAVGPPGLVVGPPATASGGKPGGTEGADSGAGIGAAPRESSCSKMSKSLVRRGEVEKGKSASSKITCREMTMLLVVRSRHR
jgi:hypothetical protein